MKWLTGLASLLVAAIVFTAKPFNPPQVKRGSPVTLPKTNFDPRPYKAKTLPDKVAVWFKETGDGKSWWIDWDAERRPFKRIIVHHSATTPDAKPEEIESYTTRIYRGRYQLDEKSAGGNDPYVKGLPIHSNHLVKGRERLITYHHLVYGDGRITTELQPLIKVKNQWLIDMVGWHAGNWQVNCESIAVCLVGTFQDSNPSDKALKALAGLIAYYKQFNPKLLVEPHNQHSKTSCPGNTWEYWSDKLGIGLAKDAVIKPRRDTFTMAPGETRSYPIEVVNTGRALWHPDSHYLNLGFAKSEKDFGLLQHLAVDKIIPGGVTWKTKLLLKAPKAPQSRGTHYITAQMERLKDGKGFGDYIDLTLVVQ